MPSSGMLHNVAFVRIKVSEEPSAFIIRVTRIGELLVVFLSISILNISSQRASVASYG
jgi:hypothetical protein